MNIDKKVASEILRKQARLAKQKNNLKKEWIVRFETFSKLCDDGASKTHIAFLGTALLAKAVNLNVDLYSIKPTHDRRNINSFSARSLCHSVLVPISAELGIDLGVSGREPLNNQPYFRMKKLNDGTPVHNGSKPSFNNMLEIIKYLSKLQNQNDTLDALRAFINVRTRYQRIYSKSKSDIKVNPLELPSLISKLVERDSEHGKVAQAVVAGLIDVFAGIDRVDSGRINDPSRKYPGDVCIRAMAESKDIEKAFEVRDKPVSVSDIHIFGKKCITMNVKEAAVVMVSPRQETLETAKIQKWAEDLGIGMTLFIGWVDFVEQVLFWSKQTKAESTILAVKNIESRLISVEASPGVVQFWHSITKQK